MKSTLRQKAIYFRKKGHSYSMISGRLGLSKSTLSGWLSGVEFRPGKALLKRVNEAKLKSAQTKSSQQLLNIQEMRALAKGELGSLSKRDLWLLGTGLYIGEGTKALEQVRIINSDPAVIRMAIKWFTDVCGASFENITVRLHIYPDNNERDSIEFWCRATGLNRAHFSKTQVDIRNNKASKSRHKLLFGTLHLSIKSNGNKSLGRSLHRRIMGWIEAALSQC